MAMLSLCLIALVFNILDIIFKLNECQLDLGDLRIPAISDDIKKLLDKAKNLEILILADNDLENVNNLPKLDLTVLELSSNK